MPTCMKVHTPHRIVPACLRATVSSHKGWGGGIPRVRVSSDPPPPPKGTQRRVARGKTCKHKGI